MLLGTNFLPVEMEAHALNNKWLRHWAQ